jgi:hypothetical protein
MIRCLEKKEAATLKEVNRQDLTRGLKNYTEDMRVRQVEGPHPRP